MWSGFTALLRILWPSKHNVGLTVWDGSCGRDGGLVKVGASFRARRVTLVVEVTVPAVSQGRVLGHTVNTLSQAEESVSRREGASRKPSLHFNGFCRL